MKKFFVIGGVIFLTKKALLSEVHRRLSKWVLGLEYVISGHHDFAFFKDLGKRHPDHDSAEWLSEAEAFSTVIAINHRQLWAHKGDESRTVSFVDCVRGKSSRTERSELLTAMREAVRFDVHARQKVVCEVCASRDGPFEIDHVDPYFITIADNFLANSLDKPRFDGIDPFTRISLLENGTAFKTLWREYHNRYAKLQTLCRDCHRKKTYRIGE
jgi:5-methylcytosine-specific restriction endonuclease McrA